jgi:hypothetical protein
MAVRTIGTRNGREIIGSGIILSYEGDEVYVYPFPDDEDYRLRLEYVFVEASAVRRLTVGPSDEDVTSSVQIEIIKEAPSSTMKSFNFASDPEYEYFLDFIAQSFDFSGSDIFSFSFSVLREAK